LDIGEGLPFFNPAYPPEKCFGESFSENGNASVVNTRQVQGSNGGALL